MSDSGSDDRRRGKRCSERKKEKISSERKSRSRSPRKSSKSKETSSSRSSSRGTFDGIDVPTTRPPSRLATLRRSKSPPYYSCNNCRRTYDTIQEIAEHEVRTHDSTIHCYHCLKITNSVEKLASHTRHHHGPQPVMCAYCREPFGKSAELMSTSDWARFREHIETEAIRRRMDRYGQSQPVSVALRGVGACPHGPPIKCRNFPHCPGHKCIYSHNMCRYENQCNKATCPFDHPNRPRNCMSCIKDMNFKTNHWRGRGDNY